MLHEAFPASDFRPPRARRAAPRGGGGLRRFAWLLLAALLVLAGVWMLHSRGRVNTPAEAPAATDLPAWSTVSPADPGFALDTTLFPDDQVGYEVRRHTGGGRLDILRFGSPDGPLGFARVAVYRPGAEATAPGTFFLDLARQAGDEGFALTRSLVPVPLDSKFGPLEAGDVNFGAGGREFSCVAWRAVAEAPALRLFGWLCAGEGRVVDRLALSCFVDQLDTVSDDPALRTFFDEADRHRDPECLPSRPARTPYAPQAAPAGPASAITPPPPPSARRRADPPAHRRVDSHGSLVRNRQSSSQLY